MWAEAGAGSKLVPADSLLLDASPSGKGASHSPPD